MKVEIVTMWYNERFFAPLFLRHYHWVDRINILLDEETSDGTGKIVRELRTSLNLDVRIIPSRFPDGMDDSLKIKEINEIVSSLSADWICVLDADEFFWPEGFADPRTTLASIKEDVVYADMWEVYRNYLDKDIIADVEVTVGNEIVNQRRHGDPVLNHWYCKPVLARSSAEPQWSIGNHEITSNGAVSSVRLRGAHWANADPSFCIDRRVNNRRPRFSQRQLSERWGFQNLNVTDEEIQCLCQKHSHDPALW